MYIKCVLEGGGLKYDEIHTSRFSDHLQVCSSIALARLNTAFYESDFVEGEYQH